jgi:hypothetical protein
MQSTDKILDRTWQEWAGLAGNYVVVIVTHRWVRVLLLLIMLVVLAWLSYTRGYRPLTENVQLPVSVLESNPRLDIGTLQTINTSRAERVRRSRPDYSSYGRVLAAPEVNQ